GHCKTAAGAWPPARACNRKTTHGELAVGEQETSVFRLPRLCHEERTLSESTRRCLTPALLHRAVNFSVSEASWRCCHSSYGILESLHAIPGRLHGQQQNKGDCDVAGGFVEKRRSRQSSPVTSADRSSFSISIPVNAKASLEQRHIVRNSSLRCQVCSVSSRHVSATHVGP
ncbi:hypothetical protein IRJ41_021235, partial [Triplophysa rosa]